MHQEEGVALKQAILYKLAEIALCSQEYVSGAENYQLHINARCVGDEIKVSFYAIGDGWQEKPVTFSKTYKKEQVQGEKQLKHVALLVLCAFIGLTILACIFLGR